MGKTLLIYLKLNFTPNNLCFNAASLMPLSSRWQKLPIMEERDIVKVEQKRQGMQPSNMRVAGGIR